MGADDDVHGAVGKPGDDLLRIRGSGKARQFAHGHAEAVHALVERGEVLLGQKRRGHEYRDLLAVLDCLERGAYGDLGFAEAHVADDDAVHRGGLFHVRLHGFDGGELVFGLHEREGVFHLVLPRGVRRERMPRRGLALGVELHQLARDLADRGARLALRRLPVGAAHFAKRRLLAPGVLTQQVQRLHWHPKLVAGLAALGGLVLQHDVFAARVLVAGFDGALRHLHELADAVGVVHHEVARLQGERVDAVAAARGASFSTCNIADAVAGDVGFGDHDQVRPTEDQARVRQRLVQGHRALDRLQAGRGHAGGHAVLAQALRHAVDRALRRRHERNLAVVLADVELERGVELLDRLRVALRRRRGLELQRQRLRVVGGEHAGRGERPPGVAGLGGGNLQRLIGAVRRSGHIEALHHHRPLGAHGGSLPAGLEELAVRRLQVGDAGAHLLRVGHQHHGAGGHELRQHRILLVRQRRDERLHAVRRLLLRDAGKQRRQRRVGGELSREVVGFCGHGVVDKQLPRGVQLNRAHLLNGALVRDGEGADVRDLVAPKLDAHGVLRGGREDVDDAAAGGELAARGHHVHMVVREVHQLRGQLFEVVLLIHRDADRLHRRQHRLAHRPRRRDDDPRHVPQHLRAAPHNVRRRRKPLVRQRLVRRELRDLLLAQNGLQLRREILRLVASGRDKQHRRLARNRTGRPGTHLVNACDVQRILAHVRDQPFELRVRQRRGEQTAQHGRGGLSHVSYASFSAVSPLVSSLALSLASPLPYTRGCASIPRNPFQHRLEICAATVCLSGVRSSSHHSAELETVPTSA